MSSEPKEALSCPGGDWCAELCCWIFEQWSAVVLLIAKPFTGILLHITNCLFPSSGEGKILIPSGGSCAVVSTYLKSHWKHWSRHATFLSTLARVGVEQDFKLLPISTSFPCASFSNNPVILSSLLYTPWNNFSNFPFVSSVFVTKLTW